MSLDNRLKRIILDLEELIEDVSDTEDAEELTKITDKLRQIYLYESV